MDALWDVLRTVRLSSAVFLEARFAAPWCVWSRVEPEECEPFGGMPPCVVAYHYVAEGSLVVESGDERPRSAGTGDIVLLPRNDAHRLASAPGLEPVNVAHLIEAPGPGGGLARLRLGGNGAITRLYCGFLGSDRGAGALLEALPEVMILPTADAAGTQWMESSIRFAGESLVARAPESSVVIAKLSEALFAEAIRRFVTDLPEGSTGWIAGLADPVVGRALAALHGDLVRDWQMTALARKAGASRSVLADRFKRLVGVSPMRYLARLRLAHAADRLSEDGATITAAALAAGYESEAAFSRAFKRTYGVPPAAWRKRRGAAAPQPPPDPSSGL